MMMMMKVKQTLSAADDGAAVKKMDKHTHTCTYRHIYTASLHCDERFYGSILDLCSEVKETSLGLRLNIVKRGKTERETNTRQIRESASNLHLTHTHGSLVCDALVLRPICSSSRRYI